MASSLKLEVRERRCPLWALAAPGLYLLASLAAVRSVIVDGGDAGVLGLLLAAGLICVFAVPAVFTSRRATLALTDDGAVEIDGRLVKVDDTRLERADRGRAVLHLIVRSGLNGDKTRTFTIESYKDAQRLVAMLPPVSAPAGALAV